MMKNLEENVGYNPYVVVPDEVRAQWAEEDIARQEYFDSINDELDFQMKMEEIDEEENQMFN